LNPKICKSLGIALIVAFAVNLASGLIGGPSVGVAVSYEASYKDLPSDQLPPDLSSPTGSRPSDWYLTDWWKLVHSYEPDDWLTSAEKVTAERTLDVYASAYERWWSWLGTQYKPLSYTDKPSPSNQLPYWTDVKFSGTGTGFGPSTNYPIKVHSSIAHNRFVWGREVSGGRTGEISGAMPNWCIEGGSYIAPDGKEWPLPVWAYPSHDLVFPSDVHPLWGWIDNHIEPWWMGMKCDNREAIEWTFWCAMTSAYKRIGTTETKYLSGKGYLWAIGVSLAFPKGVPMGYYQETWQTYFGAAYNYLPEKVDPSVAGIVGMRYYFCDLCPFGGKDSAAVDQHYRDFHHIDPVEKRGTARVVAACEAAFRAYQQHNLLNPLDTFSIVLPKQLYLFAVPVGEGRYVMDISHWLFALPILGIILILWSKRK